MSLSGNYSPLLTTAYNGALLAAEEINKSDSTEIILNVKDDESTASVTEKKAAELIAKDVEIFILSVTSGNYAAAESAFNDADTVVFSPTVASSTFSGRYDNLIRLTPDISSFAQGLAEYAIDNGVEKTAIVYDLNNKTYAESMIKAFLNTYSEEQEVIEAEYVEFNSTESPAFRKIGQEILQLNADAVLMIAGPFDTALICQHTSNDDSLKLLSPWAISDELIKNGGKAVEGTVFFNVDESAADSARYDEFRESYLSRFGDEPSYQAVRNYDTVYYIHQLFQKSEGEAPEDIRRMIQQYPAYQGLIFKYEIDEFGDCTHPLIPYTIRGGKIISLD